MRALHQKDPSLNLAPFSLASLSIAFWRVERPALESVPPMFLGSAWAKLCLFFQSLTALTALPGALAMAEAPFLMPALVALYALSMAPPTALAPFNILPPSH